MLSLLHSPLLVLLGVFEGHLPPRSNFELDTSGVGGLDIAEADERSERCEKIEDALLEIEGLAMCRPSIRVSAS